MPCCLDFIFMGNCREGEVDSSFRISTLAALAKMSWRRRALEAETSWEAPRWGKGWNKVKKEVFGFSVGLLCGRCCPARREGLATKGGTVLGIYQHLLKHLPVVGHSGCLESLAIKVLP